jgi:hypothetical protein
LAVHLIKSGVGYLLYSLSDVQSSIQRRTLARMKQYLKEINWKDQSALQLCQDAKQKMSLCLWKLKNDFLNLMEIKFSELENHQMHHTNLGEKFNDLKNMEIRSKDLKRQLDEINLGEFSIRHREP